MKAQSKLIEKLIIFEQDLFTGVITIILNSNYQQWKIYLYQGMLLWAEGGFHVYRFWQRHLNLICPHANIKLFEQERITSNSITDYYFINTLLKQKLVSREQINDLIKQRVENILFDIFQAENKYYLEFSSQSKSAHSLLKNDFNFTLSPLIMYQLLSKVYAQWFIWEEKGLTSCSPNLAPILRKDTKIERQVSPIILKNMQRMLNGKQTLRDLALQMNKDVFDVTCALVPYFFKGYIRLLEIPDLPGVNLPFVIKA
jgi:hypothetical protein